MKFGKIELKEWVWCSPHEWARYEISFLPAGSVHLFKRYQFDDGTWFPHFRGELAFLQKIYHDIGGKRFKYNQEEESKKHIDDFLIRMDNLKVFT